jgi:ribosomal-protein-alanine acetyltransferase
MTREDIPAVLEIEKHTPGSPLTEGILLSELSQTHSRQWVCISEPVFVGFIIYWVVIDEIQILFLAVHPSWRRKKVASSLIQKAIQNAPEAKKVFLEVRASNDLARKFYESIGFHVTGKRVLYYADGEAALPMALFTHVSHS